MKKNLFYTLLLLMVCTLTASAGNCRFMVDKPENVKITAQNGYGRVLDLGDGNATFSDLTSADSPLLIEATPGAAIESVVKNGNTVYPGGDGSYRIGVDDGGMMVQITTSGQGTGGGSVARDITIAGIYAQGDGISGNPFSVSYEKDGTWTPVEKSSMGTYVIPEGSNIRITPVGPYSLEKLTLRDGSQIETTAGEANSVIFACTAALDWQSVYVHMVPAAGAIKFSVTVDYAPNVSVMLEYQREGKTETLNLINGKNNFVYMPEASPIEFIATEGAEILTLSRNGEPLSPIGWGGTNGWVYELEDGDDFVVTTKGKPVTVALTVPDGNAPLESYTYTGSTGAVYEPSGLSDEITANNGEIITVGQRPGTTLTYMMSNKSNCDMMTYFQVVAGEPKQLVTIAGSRLDGVTIDVDASSRVKIVQEGGRGETLSLHKGQNNFNISDLKNALAVSATDGNQIMSVTLNGTAVTANAQGFYPVNVANGDWIEIRSRKSPVSIDMTVTVNGGSLSDVKASVDGHDIALSAVTAIKTYSVLRLEAGSGYTLENVTSDKATVARNGSAFEVSIDDADITAATLVITLKEMSAAEGNSIVIPNGDPLFIKYREFSKNSDGSYTFVKLLDNNTVNQVANGNYVNIYRNDSMRRFRSIKVNGEDFAFGKDDRQVYVEIKERTVIDVETVKVVEATAMDTFDEERNILAGSLYFVVDGERVRNLVVEAGQTVTLEAEPQTGYLLDRIEIYPDLSGVGRTIEGLTYTFTEQDVNDENCEFIMFKGFFTVNEEQKPFTVDGTTAWLVDENNEIIEPSSDAALGTVWLVDPKGNVVPSYTGVEGDVVSLTVRSTEDISHLYRVKAYCFLKGFPDNLIPGTTYTISKDDADSEGHIWISALIERIPDSLATIAGDASLSYDAAAQTLTASDAVKVFDAYGRQVISSADTTVSVAHLASGIYIAVSGNSQLKFAK